MMIKLTGIPHPDVNGGKSDDVYIDSTRVLLIESGEMRQSKARSSEAHRQAVDGLHDEVQRVAGELANMPKMTVHDEAGARKVDDWMRLREAASALNAAYGLVAKALNEPAYHPSVYCTCVSLACGTGLEHGVMLMRVWVMESPAEVAEKLSPQVRPTL